MYDLILKNQTGESKISRVSSGCLPCIIIIFLSFLEKMELVQWTNNAGKTSLE